MRAAGEDEIVEEGMREELVEAEEKCGKEKG